MTDLAQAVTEVDNDHKLLEDGACNVLRQMPTMLLQQSLQIYTMHELHDQSHLQGAIIVATVHALDLSGMVVSCASQKD